MRVVNGMGTAHVLRADTRCLPLADDSVDLIVTSPPYFALRSYQDGGEHYGGQIGDEPTVDEFLDALLDCTREWMRVLKPTGSLWVNLGDKYAERGGPPRPAGDQDAEQYRKAPRPRRRTGGMRPKSLMGVPWRYAIACMDELGLILRAEVIWQKPNGLPESITDRVRRSHEQWFHFTLQPRYYSAVDEIREPHAEVSIRRAMPHRANPGRRGPEVYDGMHGQTLDLAQMNHPLGKLPGSVWSIATEPLMVPEALEVDHYAAFPSEWPKRIIRGWSPAGVCTACGEGRRPATEKSGGRPVARAHRHLPGYTDPAGVGERDMTYTVTGYVCACNEPVRSPRGSAAAVDPSLETGRGGLNRPRGEDAGVRVVTRWEQRAEADQLRTSPHRGAMEAEAGASAFAHYLRTDRAGARPIPEHLRQAWRDRGWLAEAPPYTPAPTQPAVVLDPFGGTGTTAMVAKALGRVGITVDLSGDYGRIARWRTTDRNQLAKVLDLPKADPVDDHQLDLFGGGAL